MIRANLVPPDTRGTLIFGVRMDVSDLWRFGVALGAATIPAMLLWVVYAFLIGGALSQADELDTRLAHMASETNDVGQLASDVKRLREISNDSVWLKRSGQVVALRLAYIGNAVPGGAWLDDVTQDRTGWRIEGEGTSLDSMSRFLSGVAAASPGLQSGFASISGSPSLSDYSFKATITSATPVPQASPNEADRG